MTQDSATPAPLNRANLCAMCPQPKPAAWCVGCAREHGTHFVDAQLTQPADIILVAEAPIVPRIVDVAKLHIPFSDDAGALITRALADIQREKPSYANLNVAKTYSVLCTGMDPNKETIDRCKQFLHSGIMGSTANKEKPPVIIAMGMSAVKALGIQAKSLKEVQGRIIPGVQLGGVPHTVIPTISTKMLVTMAGYYPLYTNDLRRAFQLVSAELPPTRSLDELTKEYPFPKTVDEVREVCETILRYAENGRDPATWSISVDTETNTLFPHRATTKLLCVSFAWATGKATAIPLWHSETPYDPEKVAPYIRAVLESTKPKSFHNAKYDLKVFKRYGWTVNQFRWDTMLGEHAIEEDKKGQYGLKEITRVQNPEFAAYADEIQALLAKQEGDSQLDNIRKRRKKKAEQDAEALAGKKKRKQKQDGGFEKLPLDKLLLYAAIDTDMTRRISVRQMQRIALEEQSVVAQKTLVSRDRGRRFPVPDLCKAQLPVKSVVTNIAVPIVPVLAKMEYEGINVDRKYLDTLYDKLSDVIEESQRDLLEMAEDSSLKLAHAKSIANVLFSVGFRHPKTGVRTYYTPLHFTDKGQSQTTEKVLKHLVARNECPFASKMLVYRKAAKARDTFLSNVRDLSEADGFLHTNYNIHGTGTGRLSSNDENMQNIPKKLAGHSIKKIFIPTDDSMVFVNADAKGAEVRILTAYTRDTELIRSLQEGMDTHSFFASKIVEAVRLEPNADAVLESMGLDGTRPLVYEDFAARDEWKKKEPKYGEMLDKFRTAVKRVVFGMLYGAGPRKIAETIGISLEQAKSIIDLLFQMFPSIQRYMEQTKWELRTFGFVETYFGRRRRFAMKGAAGYLRSRAERQAVNFKIQSTSSDIVLSRLVDVAGPLERDLKGRLLLTVHDSIAFELPKKYLSQLPDFVSTYLEKRAAQAHPWLPVDFKWDYEVGPSYGELSPYDQFIENIIIKEEINEAQEAYTEEEVRTELAAVDEAA